MPASATGFAIASASAGATAVPPCYIAGPVPQLHVRPLHGHLQLVIRVIEAAGRGRERQRITHPRIDGRLLNCGTQVVYLVEPPAAGLPGQAGVQVQGHAPHGEEPNHFFNLVSPDYFRTLGTPLLLGRDFTEADRKGSSPVAIVNQRFAAHY